MNNKPTMYGTLSCRFYDAVKTFAPQREVDFFSSFIEQNPGRALEAMCGSGRLLIPLMQRGYTVDGVDNSSIMLERCLRRASRLNCKPELYKQSLNDLKIPHHYSTVTIAVGSFQLITEYSVALECLRKIHAHMNLNGTLLIDIFIPDYTGDVRNTRTAQLDEKQSIRLTTRYVFYPAEQRADAFSVYELFDDGEVVQVEDELLEIVWRTDEQWIMLLQEAGFEVVKFYDETFRASGPSRVLHAIKK
jgi:cyclopropane fatty-acyl-phospholipid synthase-like methyltransferase